MNLYLYDGPVMEFDNCVPIVGLLLHERFLKRKHDRILHINLKRKTIDFRVQRLYYLEKLV